MPIGERLTVRFGPFELDPHSGELFKNSRKLKLEGQPLQVLAILLEKPGTLVTREEICKRLWPSDTFVDSERILNADIWKLRQTLGDNAEHPRYIETLPKRGYRFIWEEAPPSGAVPVNDAHPEPKRKISRKSIALVLLVTTALLSFGYWYGRPLNPQIIGYRRLTRTPYAKNRGGFLQTDGSRVYFQESHQGNEWTISQVSVTGGDVSEISTPFGGFKRLEDMRPDGSALLVKDWAMEGGTPWVILLPSGPARKIPIPRPLANYFIWTKDGKGLLYTSDVEGRVNLFDIDSGTNTLIFSLPHAEWLRLSPDGKRIRFTSNAPPSGAAHAALGAIFEANVNGSNLHRVFPDLLPETSEGIWTPDGKLFLFKKTEGVDSSWWAIQEERPWFGLQAPKASRLYAGPLQFHTPAISKDGKKLFVVGADQKAELSIFDAKTRRFEPYASGIPASYVDFSHDGKWMAYVDNFSGVLWRSKIDGTERRQLTSPQMGVLLPRWSPDGKLIVFMEWNTASTHSIYTIPAEGGKPLLLLSGDFQPQDPTWAPDGESFAFAGCGACPGSEIRVFDLRSGKTSSVPGSKGLFSPRWSPNGRFIVAMRVNSIDLMLFDLVTKKWKVLARSPQIGWQQWSRDSRYVYAGTKDAIVQIETRTGDMKQVLQLNGVRWAANFGGNMGGWFGLTPDDQILLLRDIGSEDIYAVDLEY